MIVRNEKHIHNTFLLRGRLIVSKLFRGALLEKSLGNTVLKQQTRNVIISTQFVMYSLPVCEYDKGTLEMLKLDETEAKNFPNAKGKITYK